MPEKVSQNSGYNELDLQTMKSPLISELMLT